MRERDFKKKNQPQTVITLAMVQRNRKHTGGGISSAQEKQETIRGPVAAGPNPLSLSPSSLSSALLMCQWAGKRSPDRKSVSLQRDAHISQSIHHVTADSSSL